MPSIILSDNGVSSGSAGLKSTAASDGALALQTTTAGGTATTAVTIDASQNMGLGVTPSAWGANYKALQLVYGSFGKYASEAVFVSANAHATGDGAWKYTANGLAGLYYQAAGQHLWYNAPSGTAGNAITFTQAMTLDASGNLGIGGTSPATKLDVYGTKALASDLGVTNIRDTASYASGNGGAIVLMGKYNSGGSYVGGAYINASKENATDGNYSYALTFGTNVNGGALTERARIDSSGNFGLGTTPASGVRFDVRSNAAATLADMRNASSTGYGIYIAAGSSTSQYVQRWADYNNNALATIDGVGNLLVGTTGLPLGNGLISASSSNLVTSRLYHTVTTTAALSLDKATNDNSSSQVFAQFTINGQAGGNGRIVGNGSGQVTFASWSDARLKENIVDLPPQLANIMALRPVEFDYKDGSGHQTNFIAQEMQQVYPDCVSADDSPEQMLSISGWGKTEARLVKAIQEQQAIIQQLQADVAALKGTQP